MRFKFKNRIHKFEWKEGAILVLKDPMKNELDLMRSKYAKRGYDLASPPVNAIIYVDTMLDGWEEILDDETGKDLSYTEEARNQVMADLWNDLNGQDAEALLRKAAAEPDAGRKADLEKEAAGKKAFGDELFNRLMVIIKGPEGN